MIANTMLNIDYLSLINWNIYILVLLFKNSSNTPPAYDVKNMPKLLIPKNNETFYEASAYFYSSFKFYF